MNSIIQQYPENHCEACRAFYAAHQRPTLHISLHFNGYHNPVLKEWLRLTVPSSSKFKES